MTLTATEMPFGGVAVVARDTDRVLMIQRAQTDDDPAGGTWEFPGGCIEDGETCLQGSVREWEEETGLELPGTAELTAVWNATNGLYRGHVFAVPSEDDVDLRDRNHDADPDGDYFESLAWWEPAHMAINPSLRQELKNDIAIVQRALPGIVLKAYLTAGDLKAGVSALCRCCSGRGEHYDTGLECYGCDGSGRLDGYAGPVPCDGALGFGAGDSPTPQDRFASSVMWRLREMGTVDPDVLEHRYFTLDEVKALAPKVCPCGLGIEWDPIDGPQHLDGSVTHEDGESVSDKVFANDDGYQDAKAVGLIKANPSQRRARSGKWRDHTPRWEDFHRQTDRIVDHYAPLIQEAMAGVLPPETIRQAIETAYEQARAHRREAAAAATQAQGQGGSPVLTAAMLLAIMAIVRRILEHAPRDTRKLDEVLTELYGDAILQGAHEAAAAIDGQSPSGSGGHLPSGVAEAAAALPDDYWSSWESGHGGGAASVAQGDLAEMLRQRNIWIKGMTDTQIARIENAIRQAIKNGIPIEQTTRLIDEIVHDPRRARLIASNEYTRLFGAAQHATYVANDVWGHRWLDNPGACARCVENAAAGAIPIDQGFPNGDLPIHPGERCAVAPVVLVNEATPG